MTDEDLEEYKKTEIIRKAVADVKKRAKEAEIVRTSPDKVYANVKSRIAGNMKSQKKGKKIAKKIEKNIMEQSMHQGSPGKGSSASPSKSPNKSFSF